MAIISMADRKAPSREELREAARGITLFGHGTHPAWERWGAMTLYPASGLLLEVLFG